MSTSVLPFLPGQSWGQRRSPQWSTTKKQSISGRTYAASNWSYPSWRYRLKYEVLRARPTLTEMQQLAAFFNQMQGMYDTFYYDDPDDDSVTGQPMGIGDGVTKTWQLIRSFGGYVEPVLALNGNPVVFYNSGDWRGTESYYAGSRTNLAKYSEDYTQVSAWAPGNGTLVAAGSGIPTPSGTVTAGKLTEGSTLAQHFMSLVGFVTTAGQQYTYSVFVKAGSGTARGVKVQPGSASTFSAQSYVTVNPSTGVITGAGTDAVAYGSVAYPNGWYRVWVTATATASAAVGNVVVLTSSLSSTTAIYTGDGTGSAYVWGSQFETGTVTNYIPTGSATASKTDFTVGTNGQITFTTAPPSGVSMAWSGKFYWVCQFLSDSLDFSQFMRQFWELGQLDFETIKI